MAHILFGTLMFVTSVFLILLVLVQRGRGGGLAGAFGGMGGQSAFGTKAGDLFTRLTMGVATFWILLCVLAISVLNRQSTPLGASESSVFESATDEPGGATPGGASPTATDLLGGESVSGGLSGLGAALEQEATPNAPSTDSTDP